MRTGFSTLTTLRTLCQVFLLTALLALIAAAATQEPVRPGLAVRDGVLYKAGQPYRGIGVNYCDLFQELIHQPDSDRTLKGLRFLGEKGIPFVRFWGCGFWPSDWDLYFQDKAEWFRRMDQVVRTAETAGVGLIPSLFWRTETYPDLFDEYQDAWGDPASRTRQFMASYTAEVVGRYHDSPAIWGWEFGNELNLNCDLPNGMEFLGKKIPNLKVDLEKHERNLMTYRIAAEAFKAFETEVRKHDPTRFITTGNANPRPHAWHNATEKSWKPDDAEQALEVFGWMSPAPVDVASVHFYPPLDKEPTYAGASGIEGVLARYQEFAKKLKQPLFVGEFAAAGHDTGLTPTMDQFRARQTELIEALVARRVDLAAHWVFDYTADRSGPGLVRPDNEYAWILDQIVAANQRIAGQLEQEVTTSKPQASLLEPDSFHHYIDTFNLEDEELYRQAYPNEAAWVLLKDTMPLLACPDPEIEKSYYFRWWTLRKHLKETPDGWVITEFLPPVGWAGKYNTINCPAGHHFREARWLSDRRYLNDYATFWLRKGGAVRSYSFWIADSLWSYGLVTGDFSLALDLLPDLVANYRAWEQTRRDSIGLYWQVDDRDGMEVSIGGSGYRATINSYQYGDAVAIGRLARLAGQNELAGEFEQKAAEIRRLMNQSLWDDSAQFYKVAPRSSEPEAKSTGILEWKINNDPALTRTAHPSASHCGPEDTLAALNDGVEPKASGDKTIPRMTFWPHQGTTEWVQYDFELPVTVTSLQVYWFADTAGCRLPSAWRAFYRNGEAWEPLSAQFHNRIDADRFNLLPCEPVTTTGLRLEVVGRGTLPMAEGAGLKLCDARELHGYTPWYFEGLAEAKMAVAWRQILDPQGFYAPFGPTTAEQRHRGFKVAYEGHQCQWNGPSWPFATAITLTALGNLLNGEPQAVIDKADYFKLLRNYALSHRRQKADGSTVCWIDENLNPQTGQWLSRELLVQKNAQPRERGKDYNHSTFCDLVINGLIGLRPQPDDRVVVNPLVPEGAWDWFCLDRVAYHGRMLTILWDKTGQKYGRGAGLRIYADGQEIGVSGRLGPLEARLPDSTPPAPDQFVVVNTGQPKAELFERVARDFAASPASRRRVGIAAIFSYLNFPPDKVRTDLLDFLKLSQQYSIPVVVQLDGEQWWWNRPDLWNWWDENRPGYNPANRMNVEWCGWGPEDAIKIAWRNWGRQVRVLPPPNLMSPAYQAACRAEMEKLVPLIIDWWQALPPRQRWLLIGVKVGWESSIGVNAWYYPNGNDLLDRPEDQDPHTGIKIEELPNRGMPPIGYAAVKTAGLHSEGALTEADLAEIARRHLEILSRQAAELGLPRDKVFTHGAGWQDDELLYGAAVNSASSPGWSFYRYAADPSRDAGVQQALKTTDAPCWAAVEWLFQGPAETGPWQKALTATLADPRCRYLCIYNWEGISASPAILTALRQVVAPDNSERPQ